MRFAPDGRIFVAEKGGRIHVFDDFGDPTPALYADLSREVHDFWDRGLLGMELDPGFATGRPYVYVLYAYDKDPNSPAFPRWGDECPSPPGAMEDGCVVTGRLSRLSGDFEQVLIEDWCQQYSSHSLGSLAFGADGALYASAGEGANYNIADWGQDGIPRNPCGDPPAVVGGAQTPPTAEGGALRAQDVLTPGDPTGLGGTVLRVDPDTGSPLPDNPGTGDPNARRIVAYGLRNPFRIATRPGTNEVWVGEVGWHDWEEIDRVPNPAAAVRNFGWPCYEGTGRMDSYDAIDLNLCETLYGAGPAAHAAPYYTYDHQSRVVAGESCGVGSSSISGLAFTPPDSSFPPAYDGALFFADYSRDCIWAMLRGADGLPDPANIQTFVAGAQNPIELQFGPNGDLYYVDLENGSVRRVRSVTTNHAPVARARADRSSGDVPLTVSFDGSASTDPDGQPINHAWDLDGDGAFDDSTLASPTFTYTVAGTYTARLRVTDPDGLSDTFNLPIVAGRPPVPVITITSPAPSTTWKVDDTIRFSGSATDASGAPIPAGGLTWEIHLRHCDRVSGSCHTHTLQSFGGVASGSFPAPDHEFPSYLEIELTARDARGLSATATRRLDPQTAQLRLASSPAGARLTLGGETATAPFTRSVIRGSTNSIGAESPQSIAGVPYAFESWSNAGARTHTTQVNADTTLTATFNRSYLRRMAGTDEVGELDAVAAPGQGEVYRTVAEESGTATELWLSVDGLSCASDLVLGLYADVAGRATTLLGSGRMKHPQPGWNKVDVNVPGIEAGKPYWIGVLNPRDGTCGLRWHELNRGSPEQWSASGSLAQLPTAWVPGRDWTHGPVSGYVAGTPLRADGAPTGENGGLPAEPGRARRRPCAGDPHGAAADRARRRMGLRRARRAAGARLVRRRQPGHALRRHPHARPLRRRPLLRRPQRLGHGRRRPVARPHHRHDARGVGPALGARRLAQRARQGVGEPALVRALRPPQRPRVHHRRARPARRIGAPAQPLVAPGHDVGRADHARVRERRRGLAQCPRRHGEALRRPAADRRQRDLAGVLQGHDRRGAGLRPRPDGERDRPGSRRRGHARRCSRRTRADPHAVASRARRDAPPTAARAGSPAPLLDPGEHHDERIPAGTSPLG